MNNLYLALMKDVDTPELLKAAAAQYGREMTDEDAEVMFAKLHDLQENSSGQALTDEDLEHIAGGKGEDPALNPKTYIGKRVQLTQSGLLGTIINAWRIYLCGAPWVEVRIQLDKGGTVDYEVRYCFFHIL